MANGRKKLIFGNWKMHGSKESVKALLDGILLHASEIPNACELAVFPPFTYLAQVENTLTKTAIAWGAQNISDKEEGAFTGEISPLMLSDFGCRYVIIGHSERRVYYGETDSIIAAKYVAAIKQGIKPVLCVGETQHERQQGITRQTIERQLRLILDHPDTFPSLKNAVIAYEPVWAIGTGQTATPEQAQEVHQFIRNLVAEKDIHLARTLPILYGGSVKASNARDLFAMPDIDGGLIGGASLKAEEFVAIAIYAHTL